MLDIGCGWGRDLNIIRKAYGADAIGMIFKYRIMILLQMASFYALKTTLLML